jgi:hypothetical protein
MKNKLFVITFLLTYWITSFNANCKTINLKPIRNTTKTETVVSRANEFKATLSSSQVADLEFDYTFENIKIWSNLPAALYPRLGLRIGDLNNVQSKAVKSLIKEVTGSVQNEGWEEIQQVWMADDFLNMKEAGGKYGSGNYYIAFLGKPAIEGIFEIVVTGHHYTLANTYKNGQLIGCTPRFEAVEPYNFQVNNKAYSPISQEKDALSNLLNGLSETQLSIAKSTNVFTNILLTPSKNWMFPVEHSGLQIKSLNPSQKKLVINAIQTYTDDINDDDSKLILSKYIEDLDNTFITYSGTTSLTKLNDYIRIDGPKIWIEFSVQRGQVLPNEPYHFHSIWRDRESDYGGTGR